MAHGSVRQGHCHVVEWHPPRSSGGRESQAWELGGLGSSPALLHSGTVTIILCLSLGFKLLTCEVRAEGKVTFLVLCRLSVGI
jgi:hypothetical protein